MGFSLVSFSLFFLSSALLEIGVLVWMGRGSGRAMVVSYTDVESKKKRVSGGFL